MASARERRYAALLAARAQRHYFSASPGGTGCRNSQTSTPPEIVPSEYKPTVLAKIHQAARLTHRRRTNHCTNPTKAPCTGSAISSTDSNPLQPRVKEKTVTASPLTAQPTTVTNIQRSARKLWCRKTSRCANPVAIPIAAPPTAEPAETSIIIQKGRASKFAKKAKRNTGTTRAAPAPTRPNSEPVVVANTHWSQKTKPTGARSVKDEYAPAHCLLSLLHLLLHYPQHFHGVTFHRTIVLSSDADANLVPSGDQATSHTTSVCPLRARSRSPVSASHKKTA